MQLVVYIMLVSLCLDARSTIAFKSGDKIIELDMAINSAAYIFTQTPEADEAAIGYISKEWKNNKQFRAAWRKADKNLGANCIIPSGLRKEHLMAIHAYTQGSPLYQKFNTAVREYGASDTIYQKKFHFKSFHYLLSVALDKLKSNSHVTYRGDQNQFNAMKGEKVRLGRFASSSLDRSTAKTFIKYKFGTLFEIESNLGVPISEWSANKHEQEVLIPPIELFKVQSEPVREQENTQKWVKINLTAIGCQGVTVTVQTRNGSLEVKRGKGKCPEGCRCIQG